VSGRSNRNWQLQGKTENIMKLVYTDLRHRKQLVML